MNWAAATRNAAPKLECWTCSSDPASATWRRRTFGQLRHAAVDIMADYLEE